MTPIATAQSAFSRSKSVKSGRIERSGTSEVTHPVNQAINPPDGTPSMTERQKMLAGEPYDARQSPMHNPVGRLKIVRLRVGTYAPSCLLSSSRRREPVQLVGKNPFKLAIPVAPSLLPLGRQVGDAAMSARHQTEIGLAAATGLAERLPGAADGTTEGGVIGHRTECRPAPR